MTRVLSCVMFILLLFGSMMSCERGVGEAGGDRDTDSLFLGISFGMERQEFYDYCWKQNQQKIFTHGPANNNVEYKLKSELDNPVAMRFYPTFHEDRIFEMPVTFTYDAWAPWNRKYWADSLLVKILPVFKQWYGDDFKKLDHPTMGPVYYKIDGNRRINLFQKDDQFVQAVFTDLKVERKLKKIYAEKLKKESEESQ